ncbi:vacuolar protein sorting-associated protein Ist1 [Tanacetum coccineum]
MKRNCHCWHQDMIEQRELEVEHVTGKTCPMDLKEAIASVIFATPRCSDITELVDVKKNFRAKYGKEFVTAATELIPAVLVEKLSAVAPNIQTKVKVLSDIAKEHNVEWEATSFEESSLVMTVVGDPDYRDPPKAKHQIQQSSYASTSHNDARPTGMTSGSMKQNQSLRSNSNNSNHSSDRDNENMEFKDATSAAHAAAEAAERASYAARAAAQLAREGIFTQQNPT